MQNCIRIAQRIEPPERTAHLHPVKEPLHATRKTSVIARNRNVYGGQRAIDLVRQTPAGWKTQDGSGQHMLVPAFLKETEILLHEMPQRAHRI